MEPIQPPTQWAPGFSLGSKWPGHEALNSPPTSAEVKNEKSYISAPHIHLQGVDKNRFTFTLYLPSHDVHPSGPKMCCDFI